MCSKSLLALCALPCPGSFLWIWNVLFHCIWKCFVPSTIGFSTPQVVNSVWFYCCYRFVGNAHFLDVLTQQTAHAIHKDHKDMKFMKISVIIYSCVRTISHNHIHEHSAPQFQYPTDFPCQGRYFFARWIGDTWQLVIWMVSCGLILRTFTWYVAQHFFASYAY